MSSAARLLERTRINKSVRESDNEYEFEIPATRRPFSYWPNESLRSGRVVPCFDINSALSKWEFAARHQSEAARPSSRCLDNLQTWNRSSRPTRSCSSQREQKQEPVMRLLIQPLPLLNRCSSTTWSWSWTASSFIEAGHWRERMAIL